MQLELDYEQLGLKVGLEIHQQLDTKCKLFCNCPAELSAKEPEIVFIRRLRPTQSELGEVDPAAMFEFQKGKTIVYEADSKTSCLVEMDEEPPHDLNQEALRIALAVALMVKARPVDEVHVMRKIVIDGSNTTGFQRTAVIALGGKIETDDEEIPLQTICLEEDAARKLREEGMTVYYRIDRLGIPLIEIATAPVLKSLRQVGKIALAIGRILRATRRVKRGIGTIRQDLNVSIREGALIEIKGVQELELLPKVVEYEVRRQVNLLAIREELRKRGVKADMLSEDFVDVTELFSGTRCRVVRKAMEKGGRVLAVKLLGFGGLVGRELIPGIRLGTEMADRAIFWGRVGGIFHTDELPSCGITQAEVDALKEKLDCKDLDAVVMVADELEKARDALKAVVERAREALHGVPSETRAAKPDGTTRYMRPRPGAARMYPETDVPPVTITDDLLAEVRERLPELPEKAVRRLVATHRVHEKLARQLVDDDRVALFGRIVKRSKVAPSFIAVALTEILRNLKRDGLNTDALPDHTFVELFDAIDAGLVSKEAAESILRWLCQHAGASVREAIEALGLRALSVEELRDIIRRILDENSQLVRAKREKAFGPLMGIVMRQVRGRVDARLASSMLREMLAEQLE